MSKEELMEARSLFDQLTGASYFGLAFVGALAESKEARDAAKVIVRVLKEKRVSGLGGVNY